MFFINAVPNSLAVAVKGNSNTFEELITNMFSKKGDKVVEVNIQALNEGYQLMQSRLPEIYGDFELESTDALPHNRICRHKL
jgi:Pyruvate/2-oxoacid:ferredoxin oxidoreductase gamma subunit